MTRNTISQVNRWLATVLVLGLAQSCSDDEDDGSAATGAGGTGGGPACSPSVITDAAGACPAECPYSIQSAQTQNRYCSVPCGSATDSCPAGTSCLPDLFGDYTVCTPPCESGSCPADMVCSDGVRCLPE